MSVNSCIYLFLKSLTGSSSGTVETWVGLVKFDLFALPFPPGFLFKNMMFSSNSSPAEADIGAPLYISPEGIDAGPA